MDKFTCPNCNGISDLATADLFNCIADLREVNAQLLETLKKIIESGISEECEACEIMYDIADNAIAPAEGDE